LSRKNAEEGSPSSTAEGVKLPEPLLEGGISLEEVLARRRSVREFSDRPLTDHELSQLLWSAQGVTSGEGLRTAPSAGGLLPIELYVVSSEGLFHYEPVHHRLERSHGRDLRRELYQAALEQAAVIRAPVVIVIAAVIERIAAKYGRRRSLRYVHMEVGHAAQNLLLQATSLGLGAVVVGAFQDEDVQAVLSLPKHHRPLYLIPVGEPLADVAG